MLLPISWLKQFVKIDKTPEQIAEKLTLSGSEVEKIARHDAGLSKVVVGRIKEIKPHPDADKLCVPYVDIGKGKLLEIVCGASNIKAGDKVPVVLAGGSVIGVPKVEKRTIRGLASDSMLCSECELGTGEDHTGIFILPAATKIGEDVVKLLELDEPVLELEITPNRADCFSIQGLAREVAALFGGKLRVTRSELREGRKKASEVVKVEVKDKELCPKYTARVIENVTVKPSPLWLQNKLRQVGIKPINNVVDVTNYVMMEIGQPLHAFDFDLLNSSSRRTLTLPSPLKGEGIIIVRKAKKGEKILALDGNTYNLNDSILTITDGEKPIAIAGVMGGEETRVKENTQIVVLEAAVFNPVSVRKTSRALGLRSESSMRFEKGVDLTSVEAASNLAAKMIRDLAGGTVLRGIISVETAVARRLNAPIKISTADVARLLGIEVKLAKIKSILQSLGFGVVSGGEILSVKVPSWRADVTQSADLIEEIGRMIDYNTLPKTLPCGEAQSPERELSHRLRRKLRQFLTASGYSEILTYSFYNEDAIVLSGHTKTEHLRITNPVNEEYSYLRTSLAPWMLQKLSQNSALLSREQFRLFEVGNVFRKTKGESWKVAIGLIDTRLSDEGLFRILRGIIESFTRAQLTVEKGSGTYRLLAGEHTIGFITIYPKGSVPKLRFRSSCAVAFLDLASLLAERPNERQIFKPLPYYPQIERDLAMVVPEAVQYSQIAKEMEGFSPLLKSVELFDVYHGLGEGASLAFRLTFGSTDRTLESSEVDEVMGRLQQTLAKKYMISFR